jgi:hypothetical protein
MSDPILDLYKKLRWEALKERRDWIRWIVPIEAALLALSVSLYSRDSSQHLLYPSLLKWAWGSFLLSIIIGVLAATVVASVREELAAEIDAARKIDRDFAWSQEFDKNPLREPNRMLRIALWLCPLLFAIGLAFLVLSAFFL